MQIIGRREFVDFPQLNLFGLEAKVDTGAYTASLHCHDIEESNENGEKILHFKLLDPDHPEYNEQNYSAKEFTRKKIKNSFGESEERFVIKTKIVLGRKKIKCSLSLTNRGNMRFPVLIGRKLLKGKFLIDVNKIHTAQRSSLI